MLQGDSLVSPLKKLLRIETLLNYHTIKLYVPDATFYSNMSIGKKYDVR